MEFFKTHLSPHVRWVLLGIAGILLALLIFHAGLVVGSHQGMRGRMGERGFHPPFGAPAGFIMPDSYLPPGHGAVGTITTVTLPTLTITEPNGDTETVFVATTTHIDGGSRAASSSALTSGMRVIIFGEPDESIERINAKVIHIVP
jgi:hypothetical protein